MDIKVNIDSSQIDYDKINEAIVKKLEDASVKDVLDRYYYTEESIQEKLDELIAKYSEDYLVNRGFLSNGDARENIKLMAKEQMKKRLEPHVDGVMSTLSDEELHSLLFDIFPNVLCDVLYTKLQVLVDSAYNREFQRTRESVTQIIDSRIRR